MNATKNFTGEKWKKVKLDFVRTNNIRIEVSDFGRVRTFHKTSDGNIITGSMTNGYRIIRLKFFSPRDTAMQNKLAYLQKQVVKLQQKIKSMHESGESKKNINEAAELLKSMKKNLSKKFADDTRERTINYHALIHRLVADYFLRRPSARYTVVAHLDHNKLNNKSTNLKWMTPEENYEHQKTSPHVINEKKTRAERMRKTKTTKLTVTKVMLLKKLLNDGKPMKTLVKQFKVTDTQILRIKRGENWADVKAAK
ncbi:MAG TPA: hypothetical protein VKT28_03230 [Puia sp.]|nr:hypothetical protein [Puia sp.]